MTTSSNCLEVGFVAQLVSAGVFKMSCNISLDVSLSRVQRPRFSKVPKITAKLRASRRLRCEDTKKDTKRIIMASEMRLKSFGTFEKRTPDP